MAQDRARRGGTSLGIRSTFIHQVRGWLRFAGCLQVPSPLPRQYSAEVAIFTDYVRRERGWSEATVRYRRSRADDLLRRFCSGKRSLSDLAITTIDRALSEKSREDGRSLFRATVRNRANALRAFLRFAEDRGWCQPGLAASIASSRARRDRCPQNHPGRI